MGIVRRGCVNYEDIERTKGLLAVVTRLEEVTVAAVALPFLSEFNARTALGVSRTTMHHLVKSGRLETRVLGKKRFIVKTSLIALIMNSTEEEA